MTKAGDCCLREALFIAADHARKVDPTLAVRYQRLMLAGKHHDSAVCTLAAVLLTRIAACLRAGPHYLLRDTDGLWKAVVEAGTGRILGVSLLGPEAGEAISTVQVAMTAGVSYTGLRDAVICHPTMTEGLNILFAAVNP